MSGQPNPVFVACRWRAARRGPSLRWLMLALLVFSTVQAAESRALRLVGEVVNTTHDVTAPFTLELEFQDYTLRGFVDVQPPLSPGRWPLEGRRHGAWCEFSIRQDETTTTVFRGVLGPAGEVRGTYVVGGGGALVQYGRFWAREPPSAKE